MNRLIFAVALCVLTSPAFAADSTPAPAKPPTVAELQQQVDYWRAKYDAAAYQRDQAQAALANVQADAYAKQQAATKPK